MRATVRTQAAPAPVSCTSSRRSLGTHRQDSTVPGTDQRAWLRSARDRARARRPTASRRIATRPTPRVGFSETDAQGVVYYGRYMPYFDLARTEYHRHLGRVAPRRRRLRDARGHRRVRRRRAVRRPARDLRPRRADRHDEHHLRPRRLPHRRRRRHADGDREGDAGLHRARRAPARRRCLAPSAASSRRSRGDARAGFRGAASAAGTSFT